MGVKYEETIKLLSENPSKYESVNDLLDLMIEIEKESLWLKRDEDTSYCLAELNQMRKRSS